jgi:hypothetical protein
MKWVMEIKWMIERDIKMEFLEKIREEAVFIA